MAYLTNADSINELEGESIIYSINVGWGKKVFSAQLSIGDNGKWLFSYGDPPLESRGAGISFSAYNTTTSKI